MNGLQKAIEKKLSDLPVLGMANLLKRELAQQGVVVNETLVKNVKADEF